MFKIKYKREGNTIYAFFNSHPADGNEYKWYCTLMGHFQSKYPYLDSEFISEHIVKYLSEDKKYYGTAKCHPDDEYSQALGQHIAKHRLLDKYLSVRARIARRLSKEVYKDYYKIGKIAMTDRKRGW